MSAELSDMKSLLARVAAGQRLSVDEARAAFDIMMSGDATPAQMGGFLLALRVRGETVDEITGGVLTMRAKAHGIRAPEGAVDVVGTGGDGSGTLNVSTASGLVVAGCGVPVAKHGNRAMSSKCGAADVLAELGVEIECDLALVEAALWEAGMCFMLAPRHHGAMRNVGGTRIELGTRTIFNLLGPLANPAGVGRLMVGVFARQWIEPLAQVLQRLGAEHVWVVHGSDGLDEITTTGPTYVAELKQGAVTNFEITPTDAGLELAEAAALKGDDAETNAQALRALLDGEAGPYRDIVLLNSAATLITAGKVETLKQGVALAADAIDAGRARDTLERLIAVSQRPPPQIEEPETDEAEQE